MKKTDLINSRTIFTLMIEDDYRLAGHTVEYLRNYDFSVTIVNSGAEGISEALKTPYDVVLLEMALPDVDGIYVCQKIRKKSDVPIIMVTTRNEEADCVMGLESGADDYVLKPFSARELLARIRTAVRRYRGYYGRPCLKNITIGELLMEGGSMRTFFKGNEINLTTYEFELLYVLAQNAGRILSREKLMDKVKGNSVESFDRSIDVHVSNLRQKLGDNPRKPHMIKTVRGAGYMFATLNNVSDAPQLTKMV